MNAIPRSRSIAATLSLAVAAATLSGVALATAVAPARAADTVAVTSPDGSLRAEVEVVDGQLTYEVLRDGGTTVVAPSTLGFELRQPDVDLTSGLSISSVEEDSVDETWTPTWGTSSQVRNHANELTVHALHEASGIVLDVVFRVFDDGVGFRYHFPDQDALGEQFVVTSEATQFALPSDMTAYYLAAGPTWEADEKHYRTVPLPDVATAQTPITASRDDGLFITVHEADLTDFPSMTLVRDPASPGRLVSELIALPNGDKAVVDQDSDGFDTPWRTLTIGRQAGDLAESHLIENLNDPCAICDVDSDGDGTDDGADWIEPSTYTGVWWELQRRATTWNAGPKHGATTARIKDYIDLAADAGARAVLAEGWNTNAGGSWENQDFLTPQADVDLAEVLRYAASKDVGYIAHNETRGFVDYYDAHIEEIFSRYEELGIHAIKTGYATRFVLGGVNRSTFDQEAVRHFQRVIETAARHEITINAHEAIKPTGLGRTYPNMMTGEGVAGMEQQNYKGKDGNPPEQATILPFTRFMGGPADYTPGVLNVTWDPANLGTRVQTTTTAQLALYTTFYSPMQMLADTPENYAENPVAAQYLEDMPTTWDDSRVEAVIGDHTVTARRSGTDWYLGAVTDETDRTISVPLSFLDPGTAYVAEIYADAAETTWRGNPEPVERTESLVDSDTVIATSMVGGGGQAMRFHPASAGEQSALEEYRAPDLQLVGAPSVTFEPRDRTVTLTATVRNDGTSVGEAAIAVDGVEADSRPRIGGGSEAEVTVTMDADDVDYPGPSTITVSGEDGAPADTTQAALLPVPDQEDRDTVAQLEASGDLAPSVAQAATTLLDRAIDRSDRGDFAGTQRAMQSLRLLVTGATADTATDTGVRGAVELTTPYLGDPVGVYSVLTGIRALDGADDLDPQVVRSLREDTLDAARTAARGNPAAARAQLADLRLRVGRLGSNAATTSLQATLDAVLTHQVVEAEAATLAGGAAISTEHPGYTGTGFVKGLTKTGAHVTFRPNLPATQDYELSFRYANGMTVSPLDRQLSLTAGGGPLSPVSFPNGGQDSNRWRRWLETAAGTRNLTSGANTIVLGWLGNDTGNVNVDHLSLRASLGLIADGSIGDADAPRTTVALRPGRRWSQGPVTVEASAFDQTDPDPVIQTRLDGGTWATYEAPVVVDDDGDHVIAVRAVDAAGNTSAPLTRTFGIDSEAPTVRATRTGPRQVELTAQDTLSGVRTVEYRIGDGTWRSYRGPVAVPGRQAVALTARATDRAGNQTEDTVEVPALTREAITATLRARNGQGGIDVLRVSAPSRASNAVVRLYVRRNGARVLVSQARLDQRGRHEFFVRDGDRRATSSYQALVKGTFGTRADWTPVQRLR